MAFDGTDIQIDVVQQGTNKLGHGHQTMNEQTQTQYNRNYTAAQTTFAGRVQQASLASSDTVNQRHRSQIMTARERFENDLRLSTNTFQESQETAVNQVAQPASGIGAQINPSV